MMYLTSLIFVFTTLFILNTILTATTTRLPSLLRAYSLSCWCLGLLTIVIGIQEGSAHLFPVAAAIIGIKGTLVPFLIRFFASRAKVSLRLHSTFRPAPMWFFAIMAIVASAFVAIHAPFTMPTEELPLLIVALATIFIGLITMMARRDVLSQMIGFLVLENGINLFSIRTIGGAPAMIEGGIYSAILIGAVLMASLSRQVQELYGSSDTAQMNELID